MATTKTTAAAKKAASPRAAAEAALSSETKAQEDHLLTSADAVRAPNDPTTDPYHTRGIDPAAAEAGFRAAGYPEKGPLGDRKPGAKLALEDVGDVAVAPSGGLPNPTADAVPPPGGVINEDALVDDHSTAAHPDPKAAKAK